MIYNKKKFDVSFPIDSDIGALKAHLQTLIGIPPAMMKVMIKGLAKDEMTLRMLGIAKGTKVMVVGSSLTDILKVSATKDVAGASSPSQAQAEETDKDKLTTSKLKQHKKVRLFPTSPWPSAMKAASTVQLVLPSNSKSKSKVVPSDDITLGSPNFNSSLFPLDPPKPVLLVSLILHLTAF